MFHIYVLESTQWHFSRLLSLQVNRFQICVLFPFLMYISCYLFNLFDFSSLFSGRELGRTIQEICRTTFCLSVSFSAWKRSLTHKTPGDCLPAVRCDWYGQNSVQSFHGKWNLSHEGLNFFCDAKAPCLAPKSIRISPGNVIIKRNPFSNFIKSNRFLINSAHS